MRSCLCANYPFGMVITISDTNYAAAFDRIAQRHRYEHEETCNEAILRSSSESGQLEIHGLSMTPDLSMLWLEANLREPIRIEWPRPQPDAIRFWYCDTDQGIHHFEQADQSPTHLSPLGSGLSLCSQHQSESIELMAAQPSHLVMVACSRQQYLDQISCETDEFPDEFLTAINQMPDHESSFFQGQYLVRLINLVQEIFHNDYQDMARTAYLEAKATEFISNHLHYFRLEHDGGAEGLSDYDQQQINEAALILLKDLADPPRIPELAREVGINASKLKQGFKDIFGQTIGRYLREQRMKRAYQLLETEANSVSAAAQAVGYTHAGHFARRFKEQYGFFPNELISRRLPSPISPDASDPSL